MPAGGDVRLFDALSRTTIALVAELGADACAISRAVGDLLIMIAEHVSGGGTLQIGQGYLATEYPQTKRVLDERVAAAVVLGGMEADAAEAELLETLGYGALLMLPLELGGEVWGLVEVYRTEARPFGAEDVRAAYATLAAELGQ